MGVEGFNHPRAKRELEDQGDQQWEISLIIGMLEFSVDYNKALSPHNLYNEYEEVLKKYCEVRRKNFSNPLHYEELLINADRDEYRGVVKMYEDVIAEYDGPMTDDDIEYNFDNLEKGIKRFLAELDSTK